MSDPTDPQPVLVTGGTGRLGRAVAAELRRREVPVRILSRSGARPSGAETVTGDLGTGAGLAPAVRDVRAVVHCASDPKRARAIDVNGTRRLLDVVRGHVPEAHVVYVSIVGCDNNPLVYYQVKAECERLIAAAPVTSSIVRATQFHELVHTTAGALTRGRVALSVRDVAFQPCEIAFVATHLVDVALGDPRVGVMNLAGPQRLTLSAAIRELAEHEERPAPTILSFPAVGGVLRSLAAGSNLPDQDAVVGGASFAGWLAA